MKQIRLALALGALAFPQAAIASDAFLTQVSAGPATITLEQPGTQNAVGGIVRQLNLVTPRVAAPVTLPELGGYPLPALTATSASADTVQSGDFNNGIIFQVGLNAASIRQNGNFNTASITQFGQANQAAIYQQQNNAIATTIQRGSNNTALIVQR